MNFSDVEKIFAAMGSRKLRPNRKGWVTNCPFAGLRTGHKGTDSRPSLFVWMDWNGGIHAKCHACKAKDTLLRLVDLYGDLSGKNVSEIKAFIRAGGKTDLVSQIRRLPKYDDVPNAARYQPTDFVGPGADPKAFWAAHASDEPEITVTEAEYAEWLGNVPAYATAPEYRGLPLALCEEWELGFANPLIAKYTKDNGEVREYSVGPRLMFAIRDYEHRLVGWSGRAVEDKWKPKYYHSRGLKKSLYLYGEHKIDFSIRHAYLVEGFIDTLRLASFGYRNVLAVLGGEVSRQQIEKLAKWFDTVTVVPDGDEAGLLLPEKFRQDVGNRFTVLVAGHVPGKDPGDFDEALAHRLISEAR